MKSMAKYTLILLIVGFITSGASTVGAASGGISTDSSNQPPSTSRIENAFGLTGIIEWFQKTLTSAKDISKKSNELGNAASEAAANQAKWQKVLGSVWSATKSFFGDEAVRNLFTETFKLSLRLLANIFTILASVFTKLTGAVG